MTRTLDVDDWAERIQRETFIRTLEIHPEIGSTNDRARGLAEDPRVERPCLIVAHRQTAGRGRGANRWWSSEGALTFSLLLSPDPNRLPLVRFPELSLTAGAAVCAALRPFADSADVRLKWPNDVYVNGRKICGILIEVPSVGTRESGGTGGTDVVVGVGVNVNNRIEDAPAELRSKATSLCDVTGDPPSRLDVLLAVLQSFERHLDLLCDQPDEMRRLWNRYDLLAGRFVTVDDGHDTTCGTCEGIADDGSLIVRTAAGPKGIYSGVVQQFG